jgi:hypothetical protein
VNVISNKSHHCLMNFFIPLLLVCRMPLILSGVFWIWDGECIYFIMLSTPIKAVATSMIYFVLMNESNALLNFDSPDTSIYSHNWLVNKL